MYTHLLYLISPGAAVAVALAAEEAFDTIRVFERRETPGGTWYGNRPSIPQERCASKVRPRI